MDKVVKEGLKIDFHIHSSFSHKKDGKLVNNSTIENLPLLVQKLNDNQVNACAISDHDYFSYDLYKALKEEEGKGSIKKVFPAIEFSVFYKRNGNESTIHVVTIFDDSDDLKVQKIETLFNDPSYGFDKYDHDKSYTEAKFLEFLSKVDMDCLCLAHQKSTLTSKSKSSTDANSLGMDSFNDFVYGEYFEAYEFKNRNNEYFNNVSKALYIKDGNDYLRFFTGTDCHVWEYYPQKDKDDPATFEYTYLKCLPNFKGISLAFTDQTRISHADNFFSGSANYLESINIRIGNSLYDIPLSKGINVIIGENSIGKSLLIHKLTGYYKLDTNPKLRKKYDEFLNKYDIKIQTSLDRDRILEFNAQGEIREKFISESVRLDQALKDYFPADMKFDLIKSKVNSKINDFCENLQSAFDFNECKNSSLTLKIVPRSDTEKHNLVLISNQLDTFENNLNDTIKICDLLDGASESLKSVKNLINDDTDKEQIDKLLEELGSLQSKYKKEKDTLHRYINLKNLINTQFNKIAQEKTSTMTSPEKVEQAYIKNKNNFISQISKSIDKHSKIKPADFTFDKITDGLSASQTIGNYKFTKYTSLENIDENYIKGLLFKPLNKNSGKKIFDDIKSLTEEKFKSVLNSFSDSEEVKALDFYKNAINIEFEKDLKIHSRIIPTNVSNENGYSSGKNAQIYFDVLSSDNSKDGVYIIDQPEDDVSPSAIRKYLLDDFRNMRQMRQIILVTHNPQFVVNLDADNVIYLFHNVNNSGVLDIRSGALEYDDKTVTNSNILDIVADTLEGGVESIKRRWKCYGKRDTN